MRLLLVVFALMLAAMSAQAQKLAPNPAPNPAQNLATRIGPVAVTRMLDGLKQPWAIGFLPDGTYLVTLRGGGLLYVSNGQARRITGVPRVVAKGQGGLLDVMIPRDFATSRQVFLTYTRRVGATTATALAVGRLDTDGTRLENTRTLFTALPGANTGLHFGSRVVEARDGTLFVTLGERGNRPAAQDRGQHPGSIVRINRDGTVARDNPFVAQSGMRPEIWSWGHRNPQGAALDLQGNLWVAEHGAKGGDEVNRIVKGANYGWPVISYGVHYSGARIGEGTAKPGMQQPAHYWDPSIAPSGLMIYSGRLWPQWRGDFFVGSLKFGMISRLQGHPLREVERIRGGQTKRVRDVAEAPDGSIWFISVGNGAIYRMTPG